MSFPQITPMRPVPGAFMNTPALQSRHQSGQDPTRRQLFPSSESSGSLSSGRSGALATTPGADPAPSAASGALAANPQPQPKAASVPPVTKAAMAINAFLKSDENFPDLDSFCRRKMEISHHIARCMHADI